MTVLTQSKTDGCRRSKHDSWLETGAGSGRRPCTVAANVTVNVRRAPGARRAPGVRWVPGARVGVGGWRRRYEASGYYCSKHDRRHETGAGSESWRKWEEERRSCGILGRRRQRLHWKLPPPTFPAVALWSGKQAVGGRRQDDDNNDEDEIRLAEYFYHCALHVTSTRTATVRTQDHDVDVDGDGRRLLQPPMKPNPDFAGDRKSMRNGDRDVRGPPPLLSILLQRQCLPLRRSTLYLLPHPFPLSAPPLLPQPQPQPKPQWQRRWRRRHLRLAILDCIGFGVIKTDVGDCVLLLLPQ